MHGVEVPLPRVNWLWAAGIAIAALLYAAFLTRRN